MRYLWAVCLCLLAGSVSAASAKDTVLSFRGKLLRPHTGSGVPGVRILRFRVAGALPPPGSCSTDFRILELSDGAFSLRQAMAEGFTPSKQNRIRICSDAQSGALSEKLNVNVAYYYGGNLAASYNWLSSSPRRGKAADSVIEYANIEYHVSVAERAGRLIVHSGE